MTHDHDPDFTNPKLNGAQPMSDAETIAEVLAAHQIERGHRDMSQHCKCGWNQLLGFGGLPAHQAEMVAAALEPVIREREQAAVIEYAMREPAKFQIEFTNQPMFEKTLREREAKALEDAADALDREGVTFQKSWGSNARDEGMICGIATTGNWIRARAAGIRSAR